MFKKIYILSYAFALTLLVVFSHEICAGERPENSNLSVALKKIALFPFANYTDDPMAGSIVTEAIRMEMLGRGYFILNGEIVDDFLAKRRIRQTSTVTRLTAREMGQMLGADAVMVGGVDLYEQDGEVIVGITVRLISSMDGGIIWAEHLSYSGRDYEGLLGLGVVESIDTLTSMVAKDLVKSVPKVSAEVGDLRPFETAGVSISPAMARSGDKIRLKVKVAPITGNPVSVKAVIDGKEVSLTRDGGKYYEGVADAPHDEGMYPVDVIAYDRDMRPFSFKACAKLSIHNTPPKVVLMLDKKAMAPRRKGFILFTPVLKDAAPIDEWKIEILDDEGTLVRSAGGFGRLPEKLIWRGEGNSTRMVDDGKYTVKFLVKDAAGNQAELSDMVRVKNNPPEVQVGAKLIDEKLVFTFALPSRDEVIDVWELAIYDNKGGILETFNGKGALPPRLEYPVKEGYDLNAISFSVTVTDDVGNPFQFKKALKTFAFKNAPFAKMNREEPSIMDF